MRRIIILFIVFLCTTTLEAQIISSALQKKELQANETKDVFLMIEIYDEYKRIANKNRWTSIDTDCSRKASRWKEKADSLMQKMRPDELEEIGQYATEYDYGFAFMGTIAKIYKDINAKKSVFWCRNGLNYGGGQWYLSELAELYLYGGKKLSKDYDRAAYWSYRLQHDYAKDPGSWTDPASNYINELKRKGKITEDLLDKLRAIDEEEQMLKPKSIDRNIYVTPEINNNTFAVVIFNEKYKYESSVEFAKNDGNVFAQYCEKTLGIPEQNIYKRADCSYNQLKQALVWLGTSIKGKGLTDSKVLFYYAGHGIPDEATRTSYLLPADGFGYDITSGYSLQKLYQDLGSLTQGQVIVILDACFSGTNRSGEMMQSNTRGVALKIKDGMPPANVVVFSAAQGDQSAYPYRVKKHGLFTYFFLDKINNSKGEATLKELADYVSQQVNETAIKRIKKSQLPTVFSSQPSNDWMTWKLK